MQLPYELLREVLVWLPGSRETSALRAVCRRWDDVLRKHVAVCCVHRYGSREMSCSVIHLLQTDTVATLLLSFAARSRERRLEGSPHGDPACDDRDPATDSASSSCGSHSDDTASPAYSVLEDLARLTKGSVCNFPHCHPTQYPSQPGAAPFSLTRPSVGDVEGYAPGLLPLTCQIRDAGLNRFIVTDRKEDEATSAEDTFPNYMRLLLKFQVKHQEYSFEHSARVRLLRTYIANLENRVHCKLKLLLEQIGYVCVRYKVLLLPYLEESILSGNELRCSALRLQLSRYRLVHEQVDVQKEIVESARRPDVTRLHMSELEEYATSLSSADDALERHVDNCRGKNPFFSTLPPSATRLPDKCRIGAQHPPASAGRVSPPAEGALSKADVAESSAAGGVSDVASKDAGVQAGGVEGVAEEGGARGGGAARGGGEEGEAAAALLPFDVSVQPAVVVLREIMSVCAAQRAFLYQSLARSGLRRMQECRQRLEAQKREHLIQQQHLKQLTAAAAAVNALASVNAT